MPPDETSWAPSLRSGWFADSEPAQSACSPRRGFLPAASALLPPHTHPSCPAGPSNPVAPSFSLFLRSTGLVKVSQSPVALLYRLQCFLFKWKLLSCEYPCKEWLCCFPVLHLLFGYFGLKPCTYLWMSVFFSLCCPLRSVVLDHNDAMRRLLCVT